MINSDLFLIIESSKLKFTAADEQIADYFLNGKPPLKQSALAQKINVSSASVTRFSKKLGFGNYKELMYFYRKKLENYSDDSSSVTSDLQFRYKELINEIDERLEIEDIKTVCKHIKEHQIIHIFGLGLSAIAGEDFKFRFTRIGKYVEVVQDYDSIEMISSLLTGENLLIYLSLRGENQHVIQSLKDLKEKGVFIIIITSNQSEEINELADVTLLTSNIKNSSGAGQVSGQIPLLILIDMIYSQYISMYRENVSKWIETEHAYLQGH